MKSWLVLLSLVIFSTSGWSEALTVRSVADTVTDGTSGKRPSRGMSMAEVEKIFGAPLVKKEPVGFNPKRKHHTAITRWIYDDFLVIFDTDRVIVTVNRRK